MKLDPVSLRLFVAVMEENTIAAAAAREHLAASLSKYKLPVDITILPELPKNPVGKIDKPSLRKTLTATDPRI